MECDYKKGYNYKKAYFELFNKLTDFIEELQEYQKQAERNFFADEHNDVDDE